MAAIALMAAIGGWVVLTGQVSYTVTRGVSMNPVYHQGDLVFVVKSDFYKVGQIAAYHDSGSGSDVLHRIIGGDAETGFIFKGDNNQSVDAVRPTADQLVGRAVLLVPNGGHWLSPVLSPTGLGVLGFLFVSGSAAARNRREIPRGRRKKRVKVMARQGGSWQSALAVAKAVRRLPPVPRAGAVLVAAAAVLGIVLAVLGWMKPVTEVHRTTATAGPSMTFSYSATVPSSAAYDGTTARSPDTIFRKLAHLVDVQLRYRGHPGALQVSADLWTTTGWRSTMQLSPAKKFTGPEYQSTVRMDLDQISARAEAAAEATGVAMDALMVTLKARVDAAGHPPFVAQLPFQLGPLQLSLAGGAALRVDTSTAGGSVTTARTIWPLGMTASSARAWAVLLLLLAVCGAIGILLVARREMPVRTRSEIERRYPQLIVPVEPMASPPGKPVVNVDNFPALVKLAERYGQMILTWSRPDADDFVVRDEGITYRYRTDLENSGSEGPGAIMDDGIPPRSRRRVSAKGVLTGTEDRPTSHRYPS